MRVNSVSFKGLWQGPVFERPIGKDDTCKNGTIYKQTYFYCPFKDESLDDVIKTTQKINQSLYGLNDLRDDDPYGYEAYISPEVKIGEQLNITADEYQRIVDLKPSLFENTKDFKYDLLPKSEARDVLIRGGVGY